MGDDDELRKVRESVKKQPGARALASPVFFVIQQLAVLISVNLVFPLVLNIRWHGSLIEQAYFVVVYSVAYSITGLIFLAAAAWLSIMLECVKYFGAIRKGSFDSDNTAREIALKVMAGSQPRWLISLSPPVVPMITLALVAGLFRANLLIDTSELLMQACVLQGLLSYFVTLPWVLKAQSAFDDAVKQIESEKEEA